jgi:hypothetical protein
MILFFLNRHRKNWPNSQRITVYYFFPNYHWALKNMVWIRKKPILDPGSRGLKGTGSGSATLLYTASARYGTTAYPKLNPSMMFVQERILCGLRVSHHRRGPAVRVPVRLLGLGVQQSQPVRGQDGRERQCCLSGRVFNYCGNVWVSVHTKGWSPIDWADYPLKVCFIGINSKKPSLISNYRQKCKEFLEKSAIFYKF